MIESEHHEVRAAIDAAVEATADTLLEVSHAIHENPELAFAEHFACATLADALRERLRAGGVSLLDKEKLWSTLDGRRGTFATEVPTVLQAEPPADAPVEAAEAWVDHRVLCRFSRSTLLAPSSTYPKYMWGRSVSARKLGSMSMGSTKSMTVKFISSTTGSIIRHDRPRFG